MCARAVYTLRHIAARAVVNFQISLLNLLIIVELINHSVTGISQFEIPENCRGTVPIGSRLLIGLSRHEFH